MKLIKAFSAIMLFMFLGISVFANITYKQKRLMLTDETGDEILVQLFINTCKTGVKKCIRRENVPPQEEQLRSPRFARENPINNNLPDSEGIYGQVKPLYTKEAVLHHFIQYIKVSEKKGIKMSFGSIHKWHSFATFPFASKIILALGTASSSRFMYVGKEEKLILWIKTQPDKSITIQKLFDKSYDLNQGNLYLTLLTIENVLSDATFEKNREHTAVNQKLADLYVKSPNKFGDWYHFFGTMLAGYVGEQATTIADLYSIYRKVSRGDKSEETTIHADKTGALIGQKLRNYANRGSTEEKNMIKELKKNILQNIL